MNKQNNMQQGFVSIIVAAILMILVSLISIGFSQLMQREQRQALDRQLSTQAYYAAETAVNDVRARIQNGPALADEKTTCEVANWPTTGANGRINPAEPNVTYSCLQYDQTPLDLVYTNTIIRNSSKVFPIEADSAFTYATFEWTDSTEDFGTSGISGGCPSTDLPVSFANFTDVPMLRVDLIEAPFANPTRENLINNTATIYLYPKTCGTNSIDFNNYIGDNSGRVVEVNCTVRCSLTINGLDSNRYMARVKSVYADVGTLRITGGNGTGPLELKNAQTMVDATGKATDVLRRIEVRVSSRPDYLWPEAVVESSAGLCKLIQVAPLETVSDSACYP